MAQFEDDVLRRLAGHGLVVPTRDPNRPHTKTELKCGKKGANGVPLEGGRSFFWKPWCKAKGCSTVCQGLGGVEHGADPCVEDRVCRH